MTLQQLVYIVEVSRCGSLNRAARNLYVSQTAVSSSIKALEEELNTLLLLRSHRGIEFTQAGKEFVNYAVSLLEQFQHVESIYKNSGSAMRKDRLSVSTQRFMFAQSTFVDYIKNLPDAYLCIYKEVSLDQVISDVYEHRSDIGIISINDRTEDYIRKVLEEKELTFHEILITEPRIFCRKGHPLSSLKKVKKNDLLDYLYVYYDQGLGTPIEFSEEYQLLNFPTPKKAICSNSRGVIIDLMRFTDAYTIGSGLVAADGSGLTSVPLADAKIIRLGWICRNTHQLSADEEVFTAGLVAKASSYKEYTVSQHGA